MAYKITISDTILQKSIESVSFEVDPPNDIDDMYTYIINSIRINGKIDTGEDITVLSDWALIPANNSECYKAFTVEQTLADQLIRKIVFSKAFVISYSERYTDNTGIGHYSLFVRQMATIDIEYTNENTVKLAQQSSGNSTKPILKIVPYGTQLTKKDRRTVLQPNIQYTTPEGYTYKTDHLGRIVSAEGILQLGTAKRKGHSQKTVGREDRLPDDDGGHLIATIFKGSGDFDNLVPMNGNLNKGEWKKLENDWADALKETPPKTVQVKIKPIYKGDSQRPDKFDIKYKIGDKWDAVTLKNKPGGK